MDNKDFLYLSKESLQRKTAHEGFLIIAKFKFAILGKFSRFGSVSFPRMAAHFH